MTTYLVTGGTGLMGRHVVERLARQDDATVFVLVRAGSAARLREQATRTGNADRIVPVIGDLTADGLGLSDDDLASVRGVDHLVHVAAVYDLTADEETQQRANVDGTRRVVELAGRIDAGCLHHISSVVVAGDYDGRSVRTRSTSARTCPPRISAPSSPPSGSCERHASCRGASTVRRSSSATPRPVRWTRSTASTTCCR